MAQTHADIGAAERKNLRLAMLAARSMHEQRGDDIVVLDMRGLAAFADFFVICSASSLTRARGICRLVEKNLAQNGGAALNKPDYGSGWILADFGDVLVHIFDERSRDFYQLEELWGDAPRIDWEKESADND